jgi:hypothetical protein
MKKFHVAAALAGAVFFAFCPMVTAGETGWFMPRDPDRFVGEGLILAKGAWPDVPYVSTPYEVVNEMIRVADVREDDVVYDLGCGDGRLAFEIARRTDLCGSSYRTTATVKALIGRAVLFNEWICFFIRLDPC